jgi:hypothetical protein
MVSRRSEENQTLVRSGALDVVTSRILVSCGVLDVVANKRLDLIDGLLYTLPQSLSVFKYSIVTG